MSQNNEVASEKGKVPLGIVVLRWGARVLAVLWLAMWLMFLIGEAQGKFWVPFRSQPVLSTMMFAIVLGLALGFWKEWLGAALIVVGFLGFNIANGRLPNVPLLLPVLPAIGYFICWLFDVTRWRHAA